MNKTYLFTTNKGGVGKTTLTTNMAYFLAKKGKTIIVDLDQQGNVMSQFSYKPDDLKYTIGNYFENECTFEQALFKNIRSIPNLDVLPSNGDIEFWKEKEKDWPKVIANLIRQLKSKYEYILIDTNPTFGNLTSELCKLSDKIIIPFMCDNNNIVALEKIISNEKALNPHLENKFFLVPNQFKPTIRKGVLIETIPLQILDVAKQRAKDCGWITVTDPVPSTIAFLNSTAQHALPLTFTDQKAKIFKIYENIFNQIQK